MVSKTKKLTASLALWFLVGGTAHAAITFVKVATNSITASVIIATVTGTAGDAIVCGMTRGAADLPTCTDDATSPNTYTVRITTVNYDGASGDYISAWTASNITAAVGTLHIKCTGVGSHFAEMHCLEYSGVATSLFDAALSTFGATAGTVQTSSVTIACANEAVVGFGFSANSITAVTNFTSRDTFNGDLSEDRIVSSLGNFACIAKNTSAVAYVLMGVWIQDATCTASVGTPRLLLNSIIQQE